MNRTTKIILAGVAAIVLIAAVVAIKMIWFPGVNDDWFQMGAQKLRKVPAGKIIVRPTHFPKSPTDSLTILPKRLVGCNVTFKQMIAIAYGENEGDVWLPPSAPKNNFDFLVTALSNQKGLLRDAIEKKTGYAGHKETRDTDVLALKILDPALPNLKESAADEKTGQNMKSGRLYLTHQKISVIVGGMSGIVKMPVVDKTDLKNFYNFSIPWNNKIAQGNLTQDEGEAIL
ncbi:MAG TPA: DUF3738 domain-containing protein, partial [Candidatus Baltobacteraceae bacterium]|nr:DUF3738 domain-containing protein [Candidatus Baltobacteraceae bacterium]